MDRVTITIPRFVESVQTSKARRKKYFKRGDKIPKKYQDSRYTYKKRGKEFFLYDEEEKEFIVKNPIAAGTPNTERISGNEIYARMHERKRMVIVSAIKDSFKPYLPDKINLPFPIRLEMEYHNTLKYSNWDLDNLWIYNKCFQDLLVEKKLIPEDNVLYITKPAAPEFYPVNHSNDRKMVFHLYPETRDIILNHVAYSIKTVGMLLPISLQNIIISAKPYFKIKRSTLDKPGSLIADIDNQIFYINIGTKKILIPAIDKALGKVFSMCMQMNCFPYVEQSFLEMYPMIENQLKKSICDKGLDVGLLNQ